MRRNMDWLSSSTHQPGKGEIIWIVYGCMGDQRHQLALLGVCILYIKTDRVMLAGSVFTLQRFYHVIIMQSYWSIPTCRYITVKYSQPTAGDAWMPLYMSDRWSVVMAGAIYMPQHCNHITEYGAFGACWLMDPWSYSIADLSTGCIPDMLLCNVELLQGILSGMG